MSERFKMTGVFIKVANEEASRSSSSQDVSGRPSSGGEGYIRFALIENEQRIAQGIRNLRAVSKF